MPLRTDGLPGAVQCPDPNPCNGKHGFQGGELVLHKVHTLEENLFACLRRCRPHEVTSLGEVRLYSLPLLGEDFIPFLQNGDRHLHGLSFPVKSRDLQVRIEGSFHYGVEGLRKLGGAVRLQEKPS